tara:strand:- start:1324 stop:1647 length:324 start_codon:yes stop_codon:yes gene_type:complete
VCAGGKECIILEIEKPALCKNHTVYIVMDQGRCLIVSNEADLELKLTAYNAKIVFLNKIYLKLSKIKLGHLLNSKLNDNVEKRNQCFRELRDLLRKKRPELFTGGNY